MRLIRNCRAIKYIITVMEVGKGTTYLLPENKYLITLIIIIIIIIIIIM